VRACMHTYSMYAYMYACMYVRAFESVLFSHQHSCVSPGGDSCSGAGCSWMLGGLQHALAGRMLSCSWMRLLSLVRCSSCSSCSWLGALALLTGWVAWGSEASARCSRLCSRLLPKLMARAAAVVPAPPSPSDWYAAGGAEVEHSVRRRCVCGGRSPPMKLKARRASDGMSHGHL